jgi:hypothetical protein
MYRPNAESFLSTTKGKLDITMMTSSTVITLIKILRSVMKFIPTDHRKEVSKILKYSKECQVATFKRADKSGGIA